MCGRYTIRIDVDGVVETFSVDEVLTEFSPSYNVAPTQQVPVVIAGSRKLDSYRWGLVLPWMIEKKSKLVLNNARIETIREKGTYTHCFTKQRCLIPATGFYEWKETASGKVPYYITVKGKELFAFAGIYSIVTDETGIERRTCSIITLPANSFMEKIHERMPYILTDDQISEWIDPNLNDKEKVLALLTPIHSELLQVHQVSTLVNKVKNNTAACIKAIRTLQAY